MYETRLLGSPPCRRGIPLLVARCIVLTYVNLFEIARFVYEACHSSQRPRDRREERRSIRLTYSRPKTLGDKLFSGVGQASPS